MPFPGEICEWDDNLEGVLPYAGYFNQFGDPCTPGYGGGGGLPGGSGGGVVITGGGTTLGGNTLQQILNGILSGLAILQHQPYVPTTIQPQQQPIIYQAPIGGGYQQGGGNFAGGIQRFIEQHPMGVMLAGGAVLLLMLKPPVTRSR